MNVRLLSLAGIFVAFLAPLLWAAQSPVASHRPPEIAPRRYTRCLLLNPVESSIIKTPVVGIVTHDVYQRTDGSRNW
jgi:hypothetical protein